MSFGPVFPGQINPLDGAHQVLGSHILYPCASALHSPLDKAIPPRAGVERILQVESGTFKYYLKLVPTQYGESRLH